VSGLTRIKNTLETQGQCNAYLEAAESKQDLYDRLERIPEYRRAMAKNHCQTVWALRKKASGTKKP